jgi:hypothetical protein
VNSVAKPKKPAPVFMHFLLTSGKFTMKERDQGCYVFFFALAGVEFIWSADQAHGGEQDNGPGQVDGGPGSQLIGGRTGGALLGRDVGGVTT